MARNLNEWIRSHSRQAVFAILVVMIVIFMVQVMTRKDDPETCELLKDFNYRGTETNQMVMALSTAGLSEFQIESDRILVPKKEHAKYLKALVDNDVIPTRFVPAKDATAQMNMFMPRQQQRMVEKSLKKRQIRDMVLRLPFVEDAWFDMDSVNSAGLFDDAQRSAGVMVQPKAQEPLSDQQIRTVRDLISGSIAGIQPDKIVVTDMHAGVAYPDQASSQNSQYIKLVRWRLNRKRHYAKKIKRVLSDYPNVEIIIEVEADESRPSTKETKIAKSSPDLKRDLPDSAANRLPRVARSNQKQHLAHTTYKKQSVSANGVASIDDMRNEQRTNSPKESAQIATTSYQVDVPVQAQLPVARIRDVEIPTAQFSAPHSETVTVVVRVPFEVVQSVPADVIDSDSLSDRETIDAKFQFVKADITRRVNPMLPASSNEPVTVIFDRADYELASGGVGAILAQTAQKHWPLIAVVLVGCMVVAVSRSKSQIEEVSEPVATASPFGNDAESLEIKSKLADMIDRDPETAAKVIKDWIRDSG